MFQKNREIFSPGAIEGKDCPRWVRRLLHWEIRHPWLTCALTLIPVVAAAIFGLPHLRSDSSLDAFLPANSPALANRERVETIFGLSDPILVVIINRGPNGVFNPGTLKLVERLSEEIAGLPAIKSNRVRSLATEENIVGTPGGISISPLFQDAPRTQQTADAIREAALASERFKHLVSPSGDAAVIMAELAEDDAAGRVYDRIRALAEETTNEGESIGAVYIAGQAIVADRLGDSINADMKRLNLLCGLVITVVLVASYWTLLGLLLPLAVVGLTATLVLGVMGAVDEPFYVITNALPVIVVAIGVADTIHILGYYYETSACRPKSPQRTRVMKAMRLTWRPITITSMTDIAGFLAIHFCSAMPPMKAFGLFAAVGVAAAWALSLFLAPALLMVWGATSSRVAEVSKREGSSITEGGAQAVAGGLPSWGRSLMRHHHWVVVSAGLVALVAVISAGRLTIEEERVRHFRDGEPIKQATRVANEVLGGIHFLDIMVEADGPDGLLLPGNLAALEALEQHALSLPHVTDVVSFLDILRMTSQAVNDGRREAYTLPDSHGMAAQYLLAFASGAEPGALETLIDYDRRVANIRLRLASGKFTDEKRAVESVMSYLRHDFNGNGLGARLAGQVNVDYQWMNRLSKNHFLSVGLALLTVWTLLSIAFGSPITGLITIIPVALAVLLIYGTMGAAGIWLNAGTSMFAAIAIGTGVDFAVYTMTTLRRSLTAGAATVEEAFRDLLRTMGRPLLFSFLAVLLGFGVLMTSVVPPLVQFGILISVSVVTSFACSWLLLPALVKLVGWESIGVRRRVGGRRARSLGLVLCFVALFLAGYPMRAAEDGETGEADDSTVALDSSEKERLLGLTGDEIAARINAREDGEHVSRAMEIELSGRAGGKRRRLTRTFRKDYDDHRRRLIFYESPNSVEGTAFLNIDYDDAVKEDLRWLYLPAVRRVRRISAADRGDHFLGTDFTYEDINNQTKVNLEDYNRKAEGSDVLNGNWCLLMEAIPKSRRVRRELGYGRVVSWVDPTTWMLRKAKYWDGHGRLLKTIDFRKIRRVQGIWTAFELKAENHQTGHQTILRFDKVDYRAPVDDSLFTKRTLRWGL